MCDQDITQEEINLCISKLKDNESPGNDGLTPESYKIFKEEISEFLFSVYKEALSPGRLPPSMTPRRFWGGSTGASAPVTLSLDPLWPPDRESASITRQISCTDFVLK